MPGSATLLTVETEEATFVICLQRLITLGFLKLILFRIKQYSIQFVFTKEPGFVVNFWRQLMLCVCLISYYKHKVI